MKLLRDFRLAMAQINLPQKNSVDENIDKMEKWIKQAKDEGADLVMFGELSVSGYLLDTTGLRHPGSGSSEHYKRAEAVPGSAVRRLEEIAKRHGIYIAAGMGDLQAGVVYNSFFIISPDGYVGKQRKLHIPIAEYPYYGAGTESHVFDLEFCKLGISICFDNWFPETSRILALKGAEVILSPWMWIIPYDVSPEEKLKAAEERKTIFRRVFGARAIDNAAYVAVLDHVGPEADNFEFPGVTMVYDPMGNVISETEPFREEMILVDIKADEVEKYRTFGHHYTLKFRRPEIYSQLTRLPD